MHPLIRLCFGVLLASRAFVATVSAAEVPDSFHKSIFRHPGEIKEWSFMFVSDQTRFQKYTLNGKRGDFISLRLEGPVVGEDADGYPIQGNAHQFRLLYQLSQGIETAPYVHGSHRVSFQFSEDKPMTIWVATKDPSYTGQYYLEIETATRLPPGLIYLHYPRYGTTQFGHTINFNCSISNELGLEVEATGNDFLPIIEFGRRNGQTFQRVPWAERHERKNTVWAKAEGPPGQYEVRVSPQPSQGGSFDLVFMVPHRFRPR